MSLPILKDVLICLRSSELPSKPVIPKCLTSEKICLLVNDLKVEMIDELGKIVLKKTFFQGSATCYIETDTLYNGMYFIKISNQEDSKTFKVIVSK